MYAQIEIECSSLFTLVVFLGFLFLLTDTRVHCSMYFFVVSQLKITLFYFCRLEFRGFILLARFCFIVLFRSFWFFAPVFILSRLTFFFISFLGGFKTRESIFTFFAYK